MYVLIDVYGNKVACNKPYEDLNTAKDDLEAEFIFFTEEYDIEYGNHCEISDDRMSAWARLKGKYRVWNITKVLP